MHVYLSVQYSSRCVSVYLLACHEFQVGTRLSSPTTPPLFHTHLIQICKQVILELSVMQAGNHWTSGTWESDERFRLASHLSFPLMHVGYNLHFSNTFAWNLFKRDPCANVSTDYRVHFPTGVHTWLMLMSSWHLHYRTQESTKPRAPNCVIPNSLTRGLFSCLP